MMTMVYIWVGMLVVMLPVAFFIVRMQKKKFASANIDLAQERANAETYQEELLSRDWGFLRKWMEGQPIDAFATATVPTTMADHAKNFAIDAAKTVGLAALGVKAKFRRVETPSYVVLSGKNIYFFGTDVDGEMDQKSVIDPEHLETATLKKREEKVPMGMTADQMPKKFELKFSVDGKPVAIDVHDRLQVTPSLAAITGGANYFKSMAKNQVVGERFLRKLGERFPNLSLPEIEAI